MTKTLLLLSFLMSTSAWACPNFSGEYATTNDSGYSTMYIYQEGCELMTVTGTAKADSTDISTNTYAITGTDVIKTEGNDTKITKSEFIGDTFINTVKSFSKNPDTNEMALSNIMEIRMSASSVDSLDCEAFITLIVGDHAVSASAKVIYKKVK
jgi:hypothetical protein